MMLTSQASADVTLDVLNLGMSSREDDCRVAVEQALYNECCNVEETI